MITFIVLAIYALVVLLDLIPLKKTWNFKEGAVYLVILAISFGGLLLHSIHAKIPGPNDAIIAIVTAIFPNVG